jgi:hypothetical protein
MKTRVFALYSVPAEFGFAAKRARGATPRQDSEPEPRALFFHDLTNQVNLSDGVCLGTITQHEPMAQRRTRDGQHIVDVRDRVPAQQRAGLGG